MRGGLALLAAGAGAVLLAACGGGGGGGGGASPSPDEFRQQADAICAKYEQKLETLGTPTSPDDFGDFVDRAVTIIEEGNAEMDKLDAPDELADDWSRAMELQDENLEKVRDLQEAIRDNDSERVQQLFTEFNETEEESNELARKMGLEKCGAQT